MSVSTSERQILQEFRESYWFCWACGAPDNTCPWQTPIDYPRTLEIHHILGGAARTPHDRRNLSLLCTLCHHLVGGHVVRVEGTQLPQLRLDHMLWLKHRLDPDHYDKAFLRSLRPKVLPPMRKPPKWFFDQKAAFGWDGDMLL